MGLPVWATLVGGEHVEVREECSRAIAERDEDVCGYVVGGLFAGSLSSPKTRLASRTCAGTLSVVSSRVSARTRAGSAWRRP